MVKVLVMFFLQQLHVVIVEENYSTKIPHNAVKLLDRILLRGLSADALTYGYLMHGLCRMGQVDVARTLLNKIPSPNTVLYNILINGYVASGRFEEAKNLLYNSMVTAGYEHDAYTFNIMIDGLCKKGYLVAALEFLSEVVAKGFEPNVITYTILINGFCKQCRLEEVAENMNSMSAKGLSLTTVGYNCLICALSKDGKIEEALQLFREMSSKGCKPDIYTFNSLINGLCKNDKMDQALSLYHDMFLDGFLA
ncbi:unnamed protein product [Sphenostylis stenocarpa]|uniref:Pentatricopeptide repeat-containing protein n=1 Tax=Sphenostylis stenocarpa TaxID=92480 RepID=A0AA86VDG1_9FABA|nr:unnamed protein product [Sphenostylis stenocarpa]